MKVCSVCQRCYEDVAEFCDENHGSLSFARSGSPRELIANYRLDVLLESGAAGETYRATHIALNQPVVVRIIALNSASDTERMREILKTETQAVAAIEHPNIVRVYESGSLDGGDFYVVSESASGQTLRQYLRSAGSLSELEAVTVARQTAEALEAAHASGIIHRAVSPANIIVQHDEENHLSAKLCNFDFAGLEQQNAVAAISSPHLPIDTLRYLSPEQCSGQPIDARTDVYSLGIVLYEMLCGRSPFDAPTAAAIIFKQINEQPLHRLRYDVRALLIYVLKQSLQKGLAARLPSAGNFVRQLRQIERLVAPPPTTLRGATAQNLSAVKAVSGAATAANDILTPESSEPSFENFQSSETNALEIADNLTEARLASPIIAQMPAEEAKENAFAESDIFSEPEQIFVKKKSNGSEPFAAEPIHIKRKETVAAAFESQPILVRKKQLAPPLESEPIRIQRKPIIVPVSDVETEFPPIIDVENTRKPQQTAPDFSYLNDEDYAAHRFTPTRRPLLVGAGLLALLASIGLGMFLYNQRQKTSEPAIAGATPIPAATQLPEQTSGASSETTAAMQPDAAGIENTTPMIAEKPSATTAKRENQTQPRWENPTKTSASQSGDSVATNQPASGKTGQNERIANSQSSEVAGQETDQRELNTSLNEWVGATNARDIERQMDYYAPKVNAYYQTRNVSPEAVRAEKRRIFERAGAVDIKTGKPEIAVSPDGRTATMRFRKKYAIREGQNSRSGEVIQELRWVKSGNGWKIVSERDVKVINR